LPVVSDRFALVALELSLPYRVFPETTSASRALSRVRLDRDAVPLMGFFVPSAVFSSKEPVFPTVPSRRHLASSGFETLSTLCSPASLPVVADRAAHGIPTFRALLLPTVRRSFELPEPS